MIHNPGHTAVLVPSVIKLREQIFYNHVCSELSNITVRELYFLQVGV